MTKLEQAARQALEALDKIEFYSDGGLRYYPDEEVAEKAITALREALAEQAEQLLPTHVHVIDEIEILQGDKMAYDAIETLTEEGWIWDGDQWQRPQPVQQEPVGWYSHKGGFNECGEGQPLYAAPIEPVKQEPVCSVCCKPHDKDNPVGYFYPPANELDSWEQAAACDDPDAVPLYAAPVRTKDLTDDEIDEIPFNRVSDDPLLEYARAVIAADREKNK